MLYWWRWICCSCVSVGRFQYFIAAISLKIYDLICYKVHRIQAARTIQGPFSHHVLKQISLNSLLNFFISHALVMVSTRYGPFQSATILSGLFCSINSFILLLCFIFVNIFTSLIRFLTFSIYWSFIRILLLFQLFYSIYFTSLFSSAPFLLGIFLFFSSSFSFSILCLVLFLALLISVKLWKITISWR